MCKPQEANEQKLLLHELKLNVLCVKSIQESSPEHNAELYKGELCVCIYDG